MLASRCQALLARTSWKSFYRFDKLTYYKRVDTEAKLPSLPLSEVVLKIDVDLFLKEDTS